MAIEPPPNIMKAGQRPAKIRTGARTATKNQERDMLDKLGQIAQDPAPLVPEWLGPGRSPFEKHRRKLTKLQTLRDKEGRLKWAARGKRLWHGYAATLLVVRSDKIPSFAPLKFQGREVKYVYRRGTGRQSLIGVQHYDDPEVRLIGYTTEARKHKLYLLSTEGRLAAVPAGTPAPMEFLADLFAAKEVPITIEGRAARCPHASGNTWRYRFRASELDWTLELCMDCLHDIGDGAHQFLETRLLGPNPKVPIKRELLGHAFTLRPDASLSMYDRIAKTAFDSAQRHAEDNYVSYNDTELAQWTKERLLRLLDDRQEGYLLVADELWLTSFDEAADTYVDSDLERRALKAAFKIRPPRLRTSDRSLTKILEPYWKEHASKILGELSGGLLKPQEIAQLERTSPSESIAGLARILGARERFREFLQFDELAPELDFVVTCLQIQRSGEQRVLLEKIHAGAKEKSTRPLALCVARVFGEHATIEWQYAPHEKDAASFLEPYVREVLSSSPAKFGEALGKLAKALNVPAPKPVAVTRS